MGNISTPYAYQGPSRSDDTGDMAMDREPRAPEDLKQAYAEARQAVVRLIEKRLEFDFPRDDVEYICAALNNLDALANSWTQKPAPVAVGDRE